MALPPGFVLEQPTVNLPPGFVLETTPQAQPEKQSFFRQVSDVPLGVARGAVQGVRMIADAFGAGSETANTIKGAEEYLAGLMSAEAKKDQAEIARIMKDAEDKGVLDQVKAGLQAFATAPVDTLSQALGTAAPVIVGALGAKILGAGALVGTGVGAMTGATMGAGAIKGSIYEETKKALIEAGEDPVIAEEKAQLAQSTGGKNLDQILLGTVIGGVAAVGPLEKGGAAMLARRILGKSAVDDATETTAEAAAKGALRRRAEAGVLEALPEAGQAAQQQIAENIALQREGFDVPTMRGVAGAATLEGLAGAGLGATVGGGRPEVSSPPVEEPPPAPPPAPAPALEFKPEPYIQFPDGSVAKQSEVEAYIKTLPEDQQMAMRAKLLGLAPQEAEKEPEPPAKALEFKPEPLVVYPDGSVARRSEVEAYVQSLPEEEQIPARARLLGMGEQATQVTPEMLKKVGIRSRAAIIQRLSGLELTDPKVTEELTNFAQQPYASPEVRGNIFGFLNTIQPVKPTVTPAAAPVEPSKVEVLASPDRVAVQNTLNTLNDGDTIVTDDGDRIPVARVVRNKAGDVTAIVTTKIGEEGYTGIDFDGLASLVTPQPYIDSTTGERKFSAPATIEKPKAAALEPSPTAEVPESKTATGQQAGWVLRNKDTGEVVMETNDPAKVKALNTEKYEAVPIAQYLASLSKPQKPAETKAEAPAVEAPATRKEAQAFGTAIGAAQRYRGALRGRVNLPAQKAAIQGNFQGVLKALENSKNVVVAEIAKRAKNLGTKIQIDPEAEETYTGQSTLMRQMSIDGAKMHLDALNKIRGLAAKVDALPDGARLGFQIRDEKIDAIDQGKDAGRMSLDDIARMGHSMFAPLGTGPIQLKTKEDFKALQKAYEDLTNEYGEDALRLTSTGSATFRGIAGVYDSDTDTIRVPEYFAQREEVLAHEIVHAQTLKSIANPTKEQKPTVERLNKLYQHVKKELAKEEYKPYALESIQEFIAEGMGNPAFQFELKRIKYENTSAWDKFVQTIADLIGVKRDTAFTELLSIYSDLTTEQKAPTPSAPKTETAAVPPILDTSKVQKAKGRHPQVQAAAKLLQDKKMTREEFEKYVDAYRPIETIEAETLYPPSSVEQMQEALRGEQNKDKINTPIADGTRVGLRMDLPARDKGVPVVSIHKGKPNNDPKTGKPYKSAGAVIGYGSTGYIKDVFFAPRDQEMSLTMGILPEKNPLQTAEGTWQNLGPEETYARVKELMKDPAWTQVGFDPSRHGYFYDRKTREPVVSASEMYQVGQFLLAKDVKYAPKTDFLYSIDPTIKSDRIPSYKRGVENLRKQWDKGDITSDEFAARVDILAKQIEMAELAKEKAGRERGADFLRQRLLEAKRRGELSPEAVDFAEWFILKNPALVDDLGISIRTAKEDGVGGMYSSYGRVMYLMKERGTDQTVVHEILHHLERMMPKDVQSAIRKTWTKSLMQAQKDAKTDAEKKFFKNLTDFHFGSGSRSLLKAAIDAIKDGDISKDFYQYTSPSEFWAENGSEIMKGRFDVKGSLLGKLKQWLSELKEKARDLFGLDNKAAIIRALESLSKGDGKFVTSTLLDETTEPKLSVTGKPSLKEKIIEAGREAGQKRKLDKGAFEGVSKDLVDSLEPTFAPRNVTVQDRILGMRDNFWQRMAQGIADQYRSIKEYSEEAYMKARLSKTVDGGLEGLMFYGQVFNDGGALNIKQNTRGMFDVLKPVGKELDRYLIWVALNREASLPDAKRSINPDLVARRNELSDGNISGKSRKEVYEQVQRDMNALNRSVLKVALDAGLLNTTEGAIKDIEANEKLSPEEKREKIAELRKNPIGYERFINDLNYIPFYRVMEEGDTDSVSKAVSATGLTSQYFSKALKGGEKPFGDLMENTLRNWNHILSAAMKNQAAVATVEAAVKAGAAKPNLKPGLEMRDGKVYSIISDEIVGDGSVRPELTEAGKGTVKIVVDGKNAYYEVTDPLLLDSITSIGYLGPQSKFLDVARDFKNILQFGVTISPQFKVNNLLRDSVAAMGVSELRKNPIANVLEGVSLSDRNSPTYIAAMAGGAVFNFGTAYEGDQSRLIKRLLKMGVDRDHILDSKERITAGLRYAWDKYQEWGNKSEAANRLALYKQLRDGGMSHLEASFKARDLLDFSMQGSWPAFRVLTQVIPFLNARVQGLYKLGRDGIIPTARVINNTLTGKPTDATDRQKAQQFMIVSSAVMLASALLYLTFKDDEEYKRRDEWDKDNFWWFRLPGMDFALRVPKPFEIGALGTLVERTLEQIVDSGAEGKQFGDAVKRTLGSTFALNPIPQMFKPLVDIYANKDAFTGAPIESAGLERLSKQERMINTTSPLAIALGKVSTLFPEAMELSPVQADYLIKGYFGWLGATAASTSMYATMPFNEGEYPDARWMDRLSLGLGRELPGRGAKYVTAFYESNKEISQAFADMRHYAEIGDSEKVQKILEEKGDKIQLARFYDKTAKTMANIRKQIRVIQNDPKLDGAAKKEQIDRMNDLISTLAKQAEEVRKSMKQD